MLLRRVLPYGQSASNRFRGELIAEPGLIAQRLICQISSKYYPCDFVIPKDFSPEESALAAAAQKESLQISAQRLFPLN